MELYGHGARAPNNSTKITPTNQHTKHTNANGMNFVFNFQQIR